MSPVFVFASLVPCRNGILWENLLCLTVSIDSHPVFSQTLFHPRLKFIDGAVTGKLAELTVRTGNVAGLNEIGSLRRSAPEVWLAQSTTFSRRRTITSKGVAKIHTNRNGAAAWAAT
jgi:hypothetical protein